MKRIIAAVFGAIAIASLILWFAGILGAALIPLMSPAMSENVGEIGLTVACLGEVLLYIFGFVAEKLRRSQKGAISKYGLQ